VIAAVVLAAGAATRFGGAKQQLLVGEVLAALRAAPVDDVVVVEGAHPLELPHLAGEPRPPRLVACPEWDKGPGASLRCGLAALGSGAEAAVVVLADGPDLSPAAVARVAASWRADGGDVVAASYGGVRGHPLLLARAAWGSIPDEGLRGREPRLVPCDDLGSPGDVDRPEDLPPRLR
jgi:CTP:molybdopterin cytidylyltransferase MocA